VYYREIDEPVSIWGEWGKLIGNEATTVWVLEITQRTITELRREGMDHKLTMEQV